MAHASQSGARHCADVSGTFSGEEWAPKVEAQEPEAEAVREMATDNPLIRRLDPSSLATVAGLMGCTVEELLTRHLGREGAASALQRAGR